MQIDEALLILENGRRGDVVKDVETYAGLVRIDRTRLGYRIRLQRENPERPSPEVVGDGQDKLEMGIS